MRSAGRWIAPSLVAACTGALAAGAIEGAYASDELGVAAAAGFLAMVGIPALLAGCVLVRALIATWEPRTLAARLAEDGGGMPRLAGWVATVWLGAVVLVWSTFQTTWLLAAWTAFKPLTIGFVQAIVAAGTIVAIAAVSRPSARLFAAVSRRADARWRRRGHHTLLRPWKVFAGALGAGTAAVYVLWRVLLRTRLGPFDPTVLHAPLVGLAATALAHAAWSRLGRARLLAGLAIGGLAATAIGAATIAVTTRPSQTLAIWGVRPIAAIAIGWFDVDAIRDRLPLAEIAPTPRADAPHPDVLLFTLDAVRADRTPPYGGPAIMPALRELGERGAVFDFAFAPATDAERSFASIATGVAANRVRTRSAAPLRLDPRHVTLAERLRAGGYETAVFACCPELWGPAARTGLHRGFTHVVLDPDGTRLAEAARTWLVERTRRDQATGAAPPLFVWMHVREPARWTPASVPEALDERRRLYDKALTAADNRVVDVLRAMARKVPIVIATSAHGESLGEHDTLGHGTDLHDPQLRVPFVIAGPGVEPRHVRHTVSLVDLVPTVLELAGFMPPANLDGRPLASFVRGPERPGSPGGVAFATMPRVLGRGARAVIQGRWKLIENGTAYELYDLHDDPTEHSNKVTARPELVTVMRRLIDLHERRAEQPPF